MKRLGLMILVAVLPQYALCGSLDDFTKNYLQRIEQKNAAVCYCVASWVTNAEYSATVVFEIGSKKGLLIEKNGQAVISVATLSVQSKGFRIEDAHGKGDSHARVNKLVKELSGKQFQLLVPMRVREFDSKKPWDTYKGAP